MTHTTYLRPRRSLGTRDLYESIERDRRARQLRARTWIIMVASLAVAGAYLSGLALAIALDFTHHLFTH